MTDTVRRRRPAFDREAGVAIAQAMFHERGFDAVSVTDLVEAMDIKPPSFYAAYGSKAELFQKAMLRYVRNEALPLDTLLAPGRTVPEALAALLVAAAEQYGKDSVLRGCMIAEGLRADDDTARHMAQTLADETIKMIRDYLDQALPDKAQCLTDYVLITLRGLSSAACNGMCRGRLIEAAETAGRFIAHELGDSRA